MIFKSEDGRFPFTTPETVVTPLTETVLSPMPITLAVIGSSVIDRSLYWIKSPILIIPGNIVFELVIVLTPAETSDTVAIPILADNDWTISALKVLIPTTPSVVPYKDFAFDIPVSVIATATLPFCIPLNDKVSFVTKFPDFSYTVRATPADTG